MLNWRRLASDELLVKFAPRLAAASGMIAIFCIVSGLLAKAYADDIPDRFDFCAEGSAKRWIHVVIDWRTKEPWNVVLTTNGRNEPAKTSLYVFGSFEPRQGFLVAIMPMAKTPPLLIFDDGHAEWAGRYYVRCP